MRNININVIALLIIFYLCQCKVNGQLQGISQDHRYTVEICFDSSDYYVNLDAKTALRGYFAKITYKDEAPSGKRFGELINRLKKYLPRESKPIDVKWSIVIWDDQGKEISTCCFDAWGIDGYVDGVPVKFTNGPALWFRKYLTEAFDLKNDLIGTSPRR